MSYKLPAGLPQDPKLTVIAQKTGLTRGMALAIWIALIDHAARAHPRGSLAAVAPDEIAAALGCTLADVKGIIAALKEKKLVTSQNAVAHWGKYQKLSTPRVRAHRARQNTDKRDTNETDTARRDRLQRDRLARRENRNTSYADLI